MRDEQVAEIEVALQVAHQVDHLRLDRDVQGRDRLVGDQQLRVQDQSARDADALALAARKLVRVARHRLDAQAHLVEQGGDPIPLLAAGVDQLVDVERLADRIADLQARIERGVGVLKDHLDAPPHGHQIAAARPRDVDAVDPNLALGRLEQADDGAPEGRLAAAGFADQAERPAGLDPQGHAVDRADLADRAAQERRAHREIRLEVPDLEQRRHARSAAGTPASTG